RTPQAQPAPRARTSAVESSAPPWLCRDGDASLVPRIVQTSFAEDNSRLPQNPLFRASSTRAFSADFLSKGDRGSRPSRESWSIEPERERGPRLRASLVTRRLSPLSVRRGGWPS